jgi:hypothetical protein
MASGAAVAVFFRNSRDARERVQGIVAIANCQAFLTIASDFYFASGLGEGEREVTRNGP